MFRNINRAIALERIHIIREVYQTPRVFGRFLSSQTAAASDSNDQPANDQDELYWRRVFHYPEMKYLSLLSRIKFHPAGVGVAMASAITVAHTLGHMPHISIIPPLYFGM